MLMTIGRFGVENLRQKIHAQNDLVENACVILDLRHCREAKSRIPRACVNLEIDALHAVFCEADHAHEDTNRTGTVERCNP